ncbi:SDR family oxidoreductase [Pleomorphomonas sp. NRK KF1]|uniref:SDR family oxidoreductase n=1 Tax=Pleomorphomonas sp. NRK KF1 TaxID=2943000 RepID=UPI002044091D|nr:SDR family oxidoreductase [Pleomorphomonas sp. NRK KF1]MCM5554091.1 SDR family oxidoreductase [Pleomorphomonas sp. NRK KF1]
MTIANKVVVITGAGSGIGRATALHLGSLGAKVVLGARREAEIAGVAERIRAEGGAADHRVTDVTQAEAVAALVGRAVERFGRLDVMVNNAGIAPLSRLDEGKVAEWEAMIDVNLRGVLNGIAAALPAFETGGGHIVNVVSTAGLKVGPAMGLYAATKNAVRTLTEALRQESTSGLRVTEISPGFVSTNLGDSMPEGPIKEAMMARMQEIALPAEAVAKAIAYAIDQPPEVEIGSIVIRPTVQD